MEIDWRKMGFKTKEEYKKFLDDKMESLFEKIKKPEILAVFKRLKDR